MNIRIPVQNSSARRIAKTIMYGFQSYFYDFLNHSLGAKARFEKADWLGSQIANEERIELYKSEVRHAAELAESVTNKNIHDLDLWKDAKQVYTQLVSDYPNFEIAETFFNSVFGYFNSHDKGDDERIYVLSSQIKEKPKSDINIFVRYQCDGRLENVFWKILTETEFSVPWENKARDVQYIVEEYKRAAPKNFTEDPGSLIFDVLEAVFYRGKSAYLIGRILRGASSIPMVFPVLNNEEGGLYVDTAIFNPTEMSVIFSFTRAHFMVDAPQPHRHLHFLKQLLPHKGDYEIYASLGFPKHAKTELYREFFNHLKNSDDEFIIAPGTKGMVMSVFTLPSYDVVFKIIKDKFDPPKEVTHQIVRDKYRLVSRHDRVGRMADTQRFNDLTFPRERFSEELISELKKVAPSQLSFEGDKLIIHHLYVERRMMPLNLYLRDASEAQTENIIEEYGNAIKQLAAANIFPGDMLLKNFGVSRHNRVVFYDYDEICPLTECNFRDLPQPQTEQQELASKPWYNIAPEDVFPEEFRLFFSGNPRARQVFDELHGDIYDADFWRSLQQQIIEGTVVDVFPYRRRRRFNPQR